MEKKDDFYFSYITWLLSLDEVLDLRIEKDDGECPNDGFYEIVLYVNLKEDMDFDKVNNFWNMIGRKYTEELDKANYSLDSDVNMNTIIIPKRPKDILKRRC